MVYLAKLWQSTITQWPSNAKYCFKQHIVDSFICFNGWINTLIFSDYNDIHSSVKYFKSRAKRGALAQRVNFELCTLRTSITNLRVFRNHRYLFLVCSSYFRHRLFVIIVRTVSVSFILLFTAGVFVPCAKYNCSFFFLLKTSSPKLTFRSVRVQNPYLTHACKMLHALQHCDS